MDRKRILRRTFQVINTGIGTNILDFYPCLIHPFPIGIEDNRLPTPYSLRSCRGNFIATSEDSLASSEEPKVIFLSNRELSQLRQVVTTIAQCISVNTVHLRQRKPQRPVIPILRGVQRKLISAGTTHNTTIGILVELSRSCSYVTGRQQQTQPYAVVHDAFWSDVTAFSLLFLAESLMFCKTRTKSRSLIPGKASLIISFHCLGVKFLHGVWLAMSKF
ncbi:hypothetical protein J6590_033352 [Homalodisca vitripennis]|nr:hypothetical protein J6590_033352 [Homalodisca vitripennis]